LADSRAQSEARKSAYPRMSRAVDATDLDVLHAISPDGSIQHARLSKRLCRRW
jgi:hypothetical protein